MTADASAVEEQTKTDSVVDADVSAGSVESDKPAAQPVEPVTQASAGQAELKPDSEPDIATIAETNPSGEGSSQPSAGSASDAQQLDDSKAVASDNSGTDKLETKSDEAGGGNAEAPAERAVAGETVTATAGSGNPPSHQTAAPPASRSGKLGVALALVALLGVAAVGWQVYELRESASSLRMAAEEMRQEAAQRISATDAVAVEARAFASRTSEAFDGMQRRFGAVEARVADMEGQTAALEAVYLAATRSRSDQVLAEVEQAINAAGQQLQMAANVEAAVIALEGVEARLAQPEFGHMHALRRALVRDLETLRALPRVDVGGVALRLELILERIDTLPLAFETMLAEREEDSLRIDVAKAEGEGWQWTLGMAKALGADVWNEVKGMVRLERIDGGDPVLLSPDQTTFLRENIKMRLLTARLALLSRDGKTYASDVERAREWMERYFDTGNAQVEQSIKELSELAVVPMRVEMPSLLDTFAALRVVQARGATAAESAPASGESR